MRSIPIISLAGDPDQVAAAVGEACREVGFLVVTDHGIDQPVVDEALAQAQCFFALPTERKQELADTGIEDRGVVPDGRAVARPREPVRPLGVRDARARPGRSIPRSRPGTPMYGPNPWPTGMPGWRDAMEAYHRAADDLCRRMLGHMARSLGLHADHFEGYARDPISTLKLAHDVPMPADRRAEQFGVGAHTDWGAISVVHPGGVGGLQVLSGRQMDRRAGRRRRPGGEPRRHGPQRWTNDRYLSNVHLVVNPPDRERFSLVLFFDPDYHARIEVLDVCTFLHGDPARYEPVVAGEWLMHRFQASLAIS